MAGISWRECWKEEVLLVFVALDERFRGCQLVWLAEVLTEPSSRSLLGV